MCVQSVSDTNQSPQSHAIVHLAGWLAYWMSFLFTTCVEQILCISHLTLERHKSWPHIMYPSDKNHHHHHHNHQQPLLLPPTHQHVTLSAASAPHYHPLSYSCRALVLSIHSNILQLHRQRWLNPVKWWTTTRIKATNSQWSTCCHVVVDGSGCWLSRSLLTTINHGNWFRSSL